MYRTAPRLRFFLGSLLGLAVIAGCAGPGTPEGPGKKPPVNTTATDADAPGKKVVLAPVPAEDAPKASSRIELDALKEISPLMDTWFGNQRNERVYLQVDKPLYKPGETIWVRSWAVKTADLSGGDDGISVLSLISPKGAAVVEKRLQGAGGYATNDVELPAEVPGGEYTLRLRLPNGTVGERPLVVSRYEAPRMKKKLEFVRKSYGENDIVTATLELKRPTGEPLANHEATALLRLDGTELPRVTFTTNAEGGALVKVQLPATIAVGDGLLTILVEDGGITESISKAVPIIMKRMQLAFYPEGGALVTGLESRVYFEAKTPTGKPADVSGEVVDDQGQKVARFESYKEGLGRFAFIPAAGRTYKAVITKPAGVVDAVMLPLAENEGCVLRTFDDLDGQRPALVASVTCTNDQDVALVETIRDVIVDRAAVKVKAGTPAVVAFESKEAAKDRMGVARVTLFNSKKEPVAERIVFRNRRARMNVEVKPAKDRYAPRDQVALNIKTTDPSGAPVPADIALSVVDDTVLSFADDKTGHMLSRLYLEPELPGKVEEPNLFFDLTDDKSALAMELLMGTRGWRKFAWQPVLTPPVPRPSGLDMRGTGAGGGGVQPNAVRRRAPQRPEKAMMAPPAPAPELADEGMALDALDDVAEMKGAIGEVQALAVPASPPADMPMPAAAAPAMKMDAKIGDLGGGAEKRQAAKEEAEPMEQMAAKPMPPPPPAQGIAAGRAMRADKDWAGAKAKKMAADRDNFADEEMEEADFGARAQIALAPVRVFPAPIYGGTATPAVRTDFRETIHWVPQVKTGTDGTATVVFYLSDAVTSFRVLTEGIGQGRAGRDETVFDSKLPFSMAVKLPLEVSAGDTILVPLTLTNESQEGIDVDVTASFGPLVTAKSDVGGTKSLKASARDTMVYDLSVTGLNGSSKIAFKAAGSGLKDEFERELVVVPRGFPIEEGFAGTVKDKVTHTVDTGEAVEGTIDGAVRFYPSPTATLLSGLDGMLREPSGCFEQTSSTNYPNVMIVTYLERNNIAAPAITERAQKLMDSGYKKLVGFETPEKGYEWFGGAPGHEALTAYGLLEFMDMRGVYGDVDESMIRRTAEWIKKRRDGKGGFERNSRALDSFGGASPEVTDAYIIYALTEAKTPGLDTEVAAQLKVSTSTSDAYILALATNSLFNAGKTREGEAAAKRLASLQDASGAWLKSEQSITRSGGINLQLETTALAILALLKSENGYPQNTRKAIDWMMNNRGMYGQWGATQATVLSLKAFLAYIEATKKTQGPGTVIVTVNGKVHKTVNYEAGHKDPIVIDGLGALMTKGKNDVKLLVDGKDALPYTMAITFRSEKPATSPDAVVDLKVSLDKTTAKMGEPVRATAVVTNKTQQGQPMTLARIGLPGGLTSQDWQLKKLREDGKIAFYETRAREVILYFRDLAPGVVHEIPIDLVAKVPGTYEGPASSAYLYYTDEHKTWAPPLKMGITR